MYFFYYILITASSTSELENLLTDVFKTYDPVIPPKENVSQSVKVTFGLNLLRIVKVVSYIEDL